MAMPVYLTPLERAWRYAYRAICVAIFIFLIAPILIVIPLSFNVEPYFTFTEKMLKLDPAGYSMRWYDLLLTFGMQHSELPRDASWTQNITGCEPAAPSAASTSAFGRSPAAAARSFATTWASTGAPTQTSRCGNPARRMFRTASSAVGRSLCAYPVATTKT